METSRSPEGPDAATRPLLSAVLIVRDEATVITECLAAFEGLVDETVVYDTGSLDRTRELARAAGAVVLEGYWDDDFSRARNEAARAAQGEWLLVVDADQQVVADRAALRALLEREQDRPRPVEVYQVLVENDSQPGGNDYANWQSQLVRADAVRWVGSVHERPVPVDGGEAVVATAPPHLLRIRHLGYADQEVIRRKGRRNARIAQAQLDRLTAGGVPEDPAAVAEVLMALGRGLVGAGQDQLAVNTFEAVRELAPGTSAWIEATESLARVLLAAGHDEVVVVLADQLHEAGAAPRYADWLRAQALAQLGRPGEALTLIEGLEELVDSTGRRFGLGQVEQMRALLHQLLAQPVDR